MKDWRVEQIWIDVCEDLNIFWIDFSSHFVIRYQLLKMKYITRIEDVGWYDSDQSFLPDKSFC